MTNRVYVTIWGELRHDDLPEQLAKALAEAKFTKDGLPDKRSNRSLEAWNALTDHAQATA